MRSLLQNACELGWDKPLRAGVEGGKRQFVFAVSQPAFEQGIFGIRFPLASLSAVVRGLILAFWVVHSNKWNSCTAVRARMPNIR